MSDIDPGPAAGLHRTAVVYCVDRAELPWLREQAAQRCRSVTAAFVQGAFYGADLVSALRKLAVTDADVLLTTECAYNGLSKETKRWLSGLMTRLTARPELVWLAGPDL